MGGYHSSNKLKSRRLLSLIRDGLRVTGAFQLTWKRYPNMSQSPASSSKTTASSSNFNSIFEKALKAYKAKTKQDLIAHPLATQLRACNSPAAILTALQDQVHQFEQSRSTDERLRRWLDPTINVLYTFSGILSQGVSLVRVNRHPKVIH